MSTNYGAKSAFITERETEKDGDICKSLILSPVKGVLGWGPRKLRSKSPNKPINWASSTTRAIRWAPTELNQ
ncbi:unnamed protein product [Sphenostylis stenocarpa]|uniref:Uncharacterized protein n=1 Tax=Sphenostylis stenocarpa TaxID=92480 RepID=A0AA86SZJ0_9FABA|nr:unnamed protein product [Sphenostylis stenocarpa]